MSFQTYDDSIKLPQIYCNCNRHYNCSSCKTACICVRYYMYEVPNELIRNQLDQPFFCDQCIWNLKTDEERGWYFNGIKDKVLFEELLQCIEIILESHLIQVAFNQFLLKKYRISKKLKKILNILKNNPEIITGQNVFARFIIYCQNRKTLMGLGLSKNNPFYSQLIWDGQEIFEEFISENLFNINSPPLFEIKTSPKQENINYSYQQNLFMMYYLQDQLLNVDIYSNDGTQIKQLTLPIIMMKGVIPTMELLISSDKKYLTVIVNNYDCITYNLEDDNFKNFSLEEFKKDSKLFLIRGKIYLWANSQIWKLNETILQFECGYNFLEKLKGYNIASYFHLNKQSLFIFLNTKNYQNQESLSFIMMDKNFHKPLYIKLENIRESEKLYENVILISEVNDIMFYVIQSGENYKVIQYQFQAKKKIRKINQSNQHQCANAINLFLLSSSSRIAFVYNSVFSVYCLSTGKEIFNLISNEYHRAINQRFMVVDQKYLFKSGTEKVECWKLTSS